MKQLAQSTNQIRSRHALPELQTDQRLTLAAQRHACDLARRQTASHRDTQGRRPMARIQKAGFRACFTAENVAQGTATASGTVDAWQKSRAHARNQQDPRARSMGFGVAKGQDGRLYWVGIYAADCQSPRPDKGRQAGIRPSSW